MVLLRAAAAAAHLALGLCAAPGWSTCGGLPDAIAHTACPAATATCCRQLWVPADGHWGCCPYPNATCCGDYTCCPSGTTCQNQGSGYSVRSACVASDGRERPAGAEGGGQEVCKTGGPLPFDTAGKNVVVLGDSVSIGYTPHVAAHLAGLALVQHSPWGGDGGAEETRYGWRCLERLLAAPDGTPQRPDVLWWNFGLHNLGNGSVPGQSGPASEYAPYLDKIAAKLAGLTREGVRVVFGVTTPMMCNKTVDDVVVANNGAAVDIMAKYAIPTVDLHAAVTSQCGPAPNSTCFGQEGCFCPHCSNEGYEWLAAEVIAPEIARLLGSSGASLQYI